MPHWLSAGVQTSEPRIGLVVSQLVIAWKGLARPCAERDVMTILSSVTCDRRLWKDSRKQLADLVQVLVMTTSFPSVQRCPRRR